MPTKRERKAIQIQLKQIKEFQREQILKKNDENMAALPAHTYPPYPRTKQAFHIIIQRERNDNENKGYYAGRQEAIKEHMNSQFDKLVDALCIVAKKLAEKS